jgi:hypothetical protein
MSGNRYGAMPHATLTWKDANGRIQQATDVRQVKVYTTVQVNNGESGDLRAFSQGISSQIPGGTRNMQEIDTNLSKGSTNGLDRDTVMDVYQVGVDMVRVMRAGTDGKIVLQDGSGITAARSNLPSLTTMFNVFRGLFLKFYNAEKLQDMGPAVFFPAGQGFSGFSTQSNTEYITNGIPAPFYRQSMMVPTQLKDGVGFWVDVKTAFSYVIAQPMDDVLAGGGNATSADLRITFTGVGNKPVN